MGKDCSFVADECNNGGCVGGLCVPEPVEDATACLLCDGDACQCISGQCHTITGAPTPAPTDTPAQAPTAFPTTLTPTIDPTPSPTPGPTPSPTLSPSPNPT